MSNPQNKVNDLTVHRLTYTQKHHAKLQRVALKPLKEKEILVETHYSGVSRGTERLVYSGSVPTTEWQAMRCPNQAGDFDFPITYGYACVGKVIEIGSSVTKVNPDELIFALHPHQSHFVIDEDWANPLPEALPLDRAVLSANMETALNANWDADFNPDSRVAVIGGGVVGLLTGYLASRSSNAPVTLIDIDPRKSEIATKLGLEFCLGDGLSKSGHLFDVLFHTSASGNGLQSAIDHANFEATIVEMSWYGEKSVNLTLGGRFHSQRLKLVSSQVGAVSPKKRANISHAERLQIAMGHLKDDALDALLYPHIEFSELPTQLSQIFDPAYDALCPLVTYLSSK